MLGRMQGWWEATSLRAKITGATVIVIALSLSGIGIGTVTTVQRYLIGELDRKIDEVAMGLPTGLSMHDFASFENTGAVGARSSFFLAAVSPNGELLASNVPDDQQGYGPVVESLTAGWVLNNPAATTLPSLDGHTEWRVQAYTLSVVSEAAMTQMPATLVIGVDLVESRQTVENLASIFVSFGLVAIILSAFVTRLLVKNTFKPLKEVEVTAARFAGGDFSQRLGGATPNTEVGRLTRSLNTMLSRIDRAFADRADTIDKMRRFIGDASHELRTPLVSVRGYAELYRMGAITTKPDVDQAMERIEREAERMTALVTDLLELARLDEARQLNIVPVNLGFLAHDAALDAGAIAPDRTITLWHGGELVRNPQGLAPVTISGEENKVRQVLANLIQNALRFSPEGSPLELVLSRDVASGMGVISVVDHGEGIPSEIRDKIFDRLWRADSSRARETGGSGLGLAIVHTIITRLKGSIAVEETPGGGATFHVALPSVPSQVR
jgi:two-component system OmpR family sensor kinase